MTMKRIQTILIHVLIGLIPIIYFLSIWNKLPNIVPIHFNANFEPNNFGSKSELLVILIILFVGATGSSFLLNNLNKFDPKQRFSNNSSLTIKISWTVTIFFLIISCLIVYVTENYNRANINGLSPRYVAVLIALLFIVLGNLMNNIKPNYFFGIRTPWTLESEENWRMTHYLGSKIWFFGGLIMFLLILILPQEFAFYVLTLSIIPMAGIPVFYSYYIFRQKQKKG